MEACCPWCVSCCSAAALKRICWHRLWARPWPKCWAGSPTASTSSRATSGCWCCSTCRRTFGSSSQSFWCCWASLPMSWSGSCLPAWIGCCTIPWNNRPRWCLANPPMRVPPRSFGAPRICGFAASELVQNMTFERFVMYHYRHDLEFRHFLALYVLLCATIQRILESWGVTFSRGPRYSRWSRFTSRIDWHPRERAARERQKLILRDLRVGRRSWICCTLMHIEHLKKKPLEISRDYMNHMNSYDISKSWCSIRIYDDQHHGAMGLSEHQGYDELIIHLWKPHETSTCTSCTMALLHDLAPAAAPAFFFVEHRGSGDALRGCAMSYDLRSLWQSGDDGRPSSASNLPRKHQKTHGNAEFCLELSGNRWQ